MSNKKPHLITKTNCNDDLSICDTPQLAPCGSPKHSLKLKSVLEKSNPVVESNKKTINFSTVKSLVINNTAYNGIKNMIDSVKSGADDLRNNKLFSYLLNSYGDIYNLLTLSDKIASLFSDVETNKWYKITKKYVPLALFAYDLFKKIKEYYSEYEEEELDIYEQNACDVFKVEWEDVTNWGLYKFEFTDDIVSWLMENPNVCMFKIIKYDELFKPRTDKTFVDISEKRILSVLMEFKGTKYIYYVNTIELGTGTLYIPKSIYSTDDDDSGNFAEFRDAIYKEFILSLNFKENVLTYHKDISVRKRRDDVNFDVSSVDFISLKNRITTSLNKKYRRGIIFTGNPGTGKTSILLRIENEMRDFPMLYVTPENLDSETKMKNIFTFIKTIEPCIVIFEDFDSYDFGDKNKQLGVLLKYIDNSSEPMNAVFLATVNDTKKLNPALLRTGRFDEVIPVEEPSNDDEIYSVMKIHYERTLNGKTFMDKSELNDETFAEMKKHKITQSDYCEVIQRPILNGEEFNNDTILNSVKALLASKNAIEDYKIKD